MYKLVILFYFFSIYTFADQTYQKIEKSISDLLRADSFSSISINYQNTALIKKYVQYSPSLEYVSRSQLKLAGLRFNPKNYRAISNSYVNRIVYFDLNHKIDQEIKFPKQTIIGKTSWSENGKNLLVGVEASDCYQLWIVSIPSLVKKQIPHLCMNEIAGDGFYWINNEEIFISTRTKGQQNPIRIEKNTPSGPVILETHGEVAQNRTYQDLLKSPQDETILTQALKSQIVIYHINKLTYKKIGSEGTYSSVSLSPDKKNFLVSKIIKPYSYVVPISYFARQFEIWNLKGQVTHVLHKSGPHENIPIQGVPVGPRRLQWLPDEAASLFYVEALDGGNWKNKVDFRDELFKMHLRPEGKTKVESLYKTKNRFVSLDVLDRHLGYIVEDYERDTKWITTKLIRFENSKLSHEKILFSLNENDAYNDPGSFYHVLNEYKRSVIAVENDGESLYLSGSGATPEGYKPFLNKFNMRTLDKIEIFRSSEKSYENFLLFLDDKKFDKFITSYETNTVSPRYNLNTIAAGVTKKELLYADKNPFEIIGRLKKEVLTYKRNDGVVLSGTLYYPLDYEPNKKYPLIIDAYPLEYTDKETAGQIRSSAYKFETPYRADVMYFALRGYAVLQEAQIPIIGVPETVNDSFISQLIAGAEAAIQAVNSKNMIDTRKVGVIGHSYGAFMVANLLTHTQLFAAGIARSGAYNRTLTPFGFQSERRTFWEAKETYLKVSPFYEADKMKKPLLLIHGMADNNSGTFTLQSERYYEALKGQGAVAKLVLLPEESHSYAAIESIEHVLYEMFNWFDVHLKSK